MRILIVIVTYKSTHVIEQTINAVLKQLKEEDRLIIINNGDTQISSLSSNQNPNFIKYDSPDNLGFCGGNNLGLKLGDWQNFNAILLLNPDLILPENWLNKATQYLDSHNNIGVLSGPLISYDFRNKHPLSRIDSLGIGRKNLKWCDLGQGQPVNGELNNLSFNKHPLAICGALMLIPKIVVETVMIDNQLFDERFSSYKEDIDLSLRIKKAGFQLVLEKNLFAYHGRGWNKNRNQVPYPLRLQSARNEILLHWKNCKHLLFISLLKWCYVRFFEKK